MCTSDYDQRIKKLFLQYGQIIRAEKENEMITFLNTLNISEKVIWKEIFHQIVDDLMEKKKQKSLTIQSLLQIKSRFKEFITNSWITDIPFNEFLRYSLSVASEFVESKQVADMEPFIRIACQNDHQLTFKHYNTLFYLDAYISDYINLLIQMY